MFFESWDNIHRVIVVDVLAYAGLVALLRISGNRTLSKLNAFDLVVSVAFGSTLSAILVNERGSLSVIPANQAGNRSAYAGLADAGH